MHAAARSGHADPGAADCLLCFWPWGVLTGRTWHRRDSGAADEPVDEDDGEEPVFAPEKGNVAFASAADGWAFHVGQFAALYAAKMGANPRALARAMWGDFAYQAKTKRIVRIRPEQHGKAKPLFVQACPSTAAHPACTHVLLPWWHSGCRIVCFAGRLSPCTA